MMRHVGLIFIFIIKFQSQLAENGLKACMTKQSINKTTYL